jgi:DNA-binding CsgD family transcriptional regulator
MAASRANPQRWTRDASAQPDEVAVVEAAYSLDGSEIEWLERVASAASPLFDRALGVTASTWEAPHNMLALSTVGGPEGFAGAVAQALNGSSTEIKLSLFRQSPVTTLSASGAAKWVVADPASQALLGLGVRDSISIGSVPVYGRAPPILAVNLQAYLSEPARLSRRFVARWSRIASHLSAGIRVRRALTAAGTSATSRPDPVAASEAILTPNGKLSHAEEPAKKAHAVLARAVAAIDQARGRKRRDDSDAALELWQGLVAGRWSLLEHFDRDGKRLIVARKNDPTAEGAEVLSARERYVLAARARGMALKLIGYELGLSVSSVSRTLSAGMRKLGILHETELVALYAPSAPLLSAQPHASSHKQQ